MGALSNVEAIGRHAAALKFALAHLDHMRRHHPQVDNTPGCWAMQRIGAWEPVHCITDFAGVLPKPLDEPRPFGRWAWEFTRRNGRVPTMDECRSHRDGRRIRVPAA